MSRVGCVTSIISQMTDAKSLLDVGCREGILRLGLPEQIQYFGCDLFPAGDHVAYVGDFLAMKIDRKFDVVTAVDVLEHMEHPSLAFDKLVKLARKCLIVSLPNCYDLKSRYAFVAKGRLGGKYCFSVDEPLDRHRWLMGVREIEAFYQAKAALHKLRLSVKGVTYGSSGHKTLVSSAGRPLSSVLARDLATESVIGAFYFPETALSEGTDANRDKDELTGRERITCGPPQ